MSVDSDTLLAILAVCLKRKENENRNTKKTKKRLWMKNVRHCNRREFTYQDLLKEIKITPKNDFRHFFAIEASIYEELLEMIGPLIKKKDTLMRDAIPVGLRLATTLRFLATGNHFEDLKTSSPMSSLTISKVVLETCEAIITRLKDYIKLPETHHEWKATAKDFSNKWKFPNCLGVVNGKHISIVKPNGNYSLYYNHEKCFSVVLLAVVNAEYEFMAVDVDISSNATGREDFFQTSLGKKVNEHVLDVQNKNLSASGKRKLPYVFVGEAFQLTENFIKPFTVENLSEEKYYNYRLKHVHQVSVNTFGALTSRFAVLQKLIHLAPEKVKIIVKACCYLYNFLRKKTESHHWDGIFDMENLENGECVKGSWRKVLELTSLQTLIANDVSVKGEEVRQKFVEYFSNVGN